MSSSSECVNCNPNCFDHTTDGCIEVTIGSDPLNIKAGSDSLKSALSKIISAVSCLQEEQCDPCDKCGESSNSSGLSNLGLTETNSPLTTIHDKTMTLKVTPRKTDTAIEYDLRTILKDMNSDVNLTKAEAFGTVNGKGARIFNSNSEFGSFNAKPENFPVNLNIEVTSVGSSGQQLLKFNRSLLNALQTTEEFVTKTDLNQTAMDSQKDVNSLFEKRINSVQSQINSIETVSSNGNTGFNAIFTDLQTQISSLQAQVDDTSEQDATIQNINQRLDSQQAQIDSQAVEITKIKQQIITLQQIINQ